MRIIVFDTETTGIYSPGLDIESQPYICQFASISIETDSSKSFFNEVSRINQYINVPISMPLDCVNIHGISNGMLEGKPIFSNVVDTILDEFGKADYAVAHNISFDKGMMECELKRLNRDLKFLPENTFDTMIETKELLNLPGRHGRIKSPRLDELYNFLFNSNMINAHNAIHDVEATVKCLFELFKREIFNPVEPSQGSLF